MQLKPYQLSKTLHLGIILKGRLQKAWWLYLILGALGIYHIPTMGQDDFSTFLVVAACAFPLSGVFSALLHIMARGNQHLYTTRHLSLHKQMLNIRDESGQEGAVDLSQLKLAEEHGNYWLLRQEGSAYYIIPKSAFEHDAQQQAFKQHIGQYVAVG